jgi:hypothetical protein
MSQIGVVTLAEAMSKDAWEKSGLHCPWKPYLPIEEPQEAAQGDEKETGGK